MDRLSARSLEWARTHIEKFGDTDIFPVPFEFDAITHCWSWIKEQLRTEDLGAHKGRTATRLLIPKPRGGFRVAVQLDPLDCVTYASLVYEAAGCIEAYRIPKSQNIACSYRVDADSGGRLFEPQSGWKNFHQKSVELAADPEYSHVLLADVADFYNQLNHHRIENALESAGIQPDRAQNIERFLSRLTAKQSRGLPVGPTASILLAELCLNDVDALLLRKGATHVRYVDDFRIFCSSRGSALELLHDLTDYLYTAHRLSLETSKTKILFKKAFIDKELKDPDEEEQRARVDKFNELVEEFLPANQWYSEPIEIPDDEELDFQAARDALVELFDDCIGKPPLQLGSARHLLRRAKKMNTAVLNDRVTAHLEGLAPVLRDAVRYLIATVPKKTANERGAEVLKFLEQSSIAFLPFVRLWALELMEKRGDMVNRQEALRFAKESEVQLGIRPYALLARKYKLIDWVRAQKETWMNHGPWERRAIIWAGSVLPKNERRHWLDLVQESEDPLDRAVAQFAATS